MNTNRNKIAIGMGALAASGLLSLAVPTGTSEAIFWKPPMSCTTRAALYPVRAGLCTRTTGNARLDQNMTKPATRAPTAAR